MVNLSWTQNSNNITIWCKFILVFMVTSLKLQKKKKKSNSVLSKIVCVKKISFYINFCLILTFQKYK